MRMIPAKEFGRKLTWPDRMFYLVIFALLLWVVFEVRV
jgi:hypothetical protein